jgi:hypothetical protein
MKMEMTVVKRCKGLENEPNMTPNSNQYLHLVADKNAN